MSARRSVVPAKAPGFRASDDHAAVITRSLDGELPAVDVATVADAEAVAAIYAPMVTGTVTSFEMEPPSVGEIRRRIEETLPGFPWLVCRRGGDVLGYAYAHAFAPRAAYAWSVETSVYVDAGARRLGIARRLYGALLPILAEQGYHRAFAGITLPNPASVSLHESVGFTPAGVYRRVGWKLGSWWDVGWWQLDLQAPANAEPAAEPIPFSGLKTLS